VVYGGFSQEQSDVLEQMNPVIQTFDEIQKKDILKQCGVSAMLHGHREGFCLPGHPQQERAPQCTGVGNHENATP
jgi:hypothetical protein